MDSVKRSRGRAVTLGLPAHGDCFFVLVILVFLTCLQLRTCAIEETLWGEFHKIESRIQSLDDPRLGRSSDSSEKYGSINVKNELPVLESTNAETLQIWQTLNQQELQLFESQVQEVDTTRISPHQSQEEDSNIRRVSRSLLQDNLGEADLLLQFKAGIENYTDGALDGWTTGQRSSYCSWTTVICNDELRVVSLNFSGLKMNGTLGPSLGRLEYLENLDLSHNFLLSKLPPEWGQLQRLQTINVHDNYLFGGIPAEYGNMSSLRVLYLGVQGWFFNGSIPEELGLLSELEVLALGTLFNYDTKQEYYPYRSNKMIGPIPPSIGNCTKLWYLDFFGNNNLTGPIPKEYGQLVNLEYLSIEQNNFTGFIPSEMGNLTKLKFLHFGNNALTGEFPVELTKLSRLEFLNVGTNFLTGNFVTVPSTSWSRLEKLFIDGNEFNGPFPLAVTTLTALTKFYMFNNEFTGKLPENLGQLSNLFEFSFRSNHLEGELPDSLNNCTQLQMLDAANNKLTGSLEPLSNLSLLYYLNLGSSYSSKNITWENLRGHTPDLVLNTFTGTLTDKMIAQWPLLQYLYLDTNAFFGPIPKALGNLTDLKDLLLNDNHFDGPIPEELGNLPNLTLLFLQDNKLSGSIPPSLANLKNIKQINLGNNSLIGRIPADFGGLGNLEYLRLYGNNFSGEIPGELGRLQNLKYLILYRNQLNGSIPASLSNCSSLQNLRLSQNSLTGTVTQIDFLRLHFLNSFSVSGNQLSGGFPESIYNCKGLKLLDLSSNEFSGKLPDDAASLQTFPILRVLALSLNRFTGSIPNWIWHLGELQVLDLSHNLFTGSCPSDLTGLAGFNHSVALTDGSDGSVGGATQVGVGKRLYEQISIQAKGTRLVYEYVLETLTSVDLSFNQMHGELPGELGTLQRLTYLNLAHNNFTGPISQNLGDLLQLQSLDLSANEFTGEIPLSLAQPSLGYLNLSYNFLEGEIPSVNAFSTRYDVRSFKPGNDGLCGPPLVTVCAPKNTDSTNSSTSADSSSSSKFFDGAFLQAFEIGMAIGIVLVLVTIGLTPTLRSWLLKPRAYSTSPKPLRFGVFKESL